MRKRLAVFSICLIVCSVFINIFHSYIIANFAALPSLEYSIQSDGFRAMAIGDNLEKIYSMAENMSIEPYEFLTVLMIDNKYNLVDADISDYTRSDFARLRNKIVRRFPKQYLQLCKGYKAVLSDIIYFPVPESNNKKRKWVSYVDSWGFERTYGGQRKHEGTDIMALENIRGLYPITSVCDGTITNIGWLEKGGYRIGITSENGAYYYYAHMASYADNISEGSVITKGQFLGYMGDTGYSNIEGTTGNFDVHLHFGIYLYFDNEEISINPYWVLKYLERNKLHYTY